MIADTTELNVAFRNLESVEKALELLREEMLETTPALFPIISQTYMRRMRDLRSEIQDYLYRPPAEAPFKIQMEGPAVQNGKRWLRH